jgi:ATP-dependent Zn protease
MKKNERLWAVAYHEAGHAVAAFAYGIGIGRDGITIVPGRTSLGSAHALKHIRGDLEFGQWSGTMRRQIEEKVIMCCAGGIAQRRHRPSSVRRHHAGSDRDQVFEFSLW